MSSMSPETALIYDRLKQLFDYVKSEASDNSEGAPDMPEALFMSGLLLGVGSAVRVVKGATTTEAVEALEQAMLSMIASLTPVAEKK